MVMRRRPVAGSLDRLRPWRGIPSWRWSGRLIALMVLALLGACALPASVAAAELYVFHGDGCPHCEEQQAWLDELERAHPDLTVHRLEVWRSNAHHGQFQAMAVAHGIDAGSVPTVFGFGRAWVGHSPRIAADIEAAVAGSAMAAPPEPVASPERLRLPGIGEVDLAGGSLVYVTLLIAFVDGFNPCSFWVLSLLLGLVVHSGSRARVALVGAAFLLTTTLVYGLFIAGVFSVLGFVLYLHWVQWLVAAFALFFGLVNIKDYFFYKQGISFTIAEHRKPGIYRDIRRVLAGAGSAWALLSATVVMAVGIALVELPCTAGFPVLWSAMLAERGIHGSAFASLLLLYLFVYLLDEMVVFLLAVATLRIGRFEERHGRILKLVAGTIMLALALTLVLRPQLMHQLDGSLLVFGGALLAAALAHLLWRRMA
jgi:cytochrome c biogenesis protein CcdA